MYYIETECGPFVCDSLICVRSAGAAQVVRFSLTNWEMSGGILAVGILRGWRKGKGNSITQHGVWIILYRLSRNGYHARGRLVQDGSHQCVSSSSQLIHLLNDLILPPHVSLCALPIRIPDGPHKGHFVLLFQNLQDKSISRPYVFHFCGVRLRLSAFGWGPVMRFAFLFLPPSLRPSFLLPLTSTVIIWFSLSILGALWLRPLLA